MKPLQLAIVALVVLFSAIAGVAIGRHLLAPAAEPAVALHAFLHDRLDLDAAQQRGLRDLETSFATRRRVLEDRMRAENARLAVAIDEEHRIGPRVSTAVDASHRIMGALQKETLAHVFAMRALLRPDQARRFDEAVRKALTETR
ncbi:periplasmic heavy metal sensor [Sphingomonas endophytica]|uniref:Heavy metal resistance protein n=1 Tax=Sphingomonas endophytica TaxID=869719 RepID=A0A147I7N0_9SPHN|nr:periplasmic heavy metal sensor [Sphingomonas endophytica]KTT75022.1 heavy metal resistance protein [Sphingomonas endophytica]